MLANTLDCTWLINGQTSAARLNENELGWIRGYEGTSTSLGHLFAGGRDRIWRDRLISSPLSPVVSRACRFEGERVSHQQIQ